MSRPAKAVIHLDALRHNLGIVRTLTRARICGVVKCNAYGHGALQISQILEQENIDALAVACMEEALSLRENGITAPILLLEGCFSHEDLSLVEKYDLTTQVHQKEQVDALLRYKAKTPISVWIKIDTGMHRFGFPPETFFKQYLRLKSCSHIENMVISTHFACADNPQNPYTYQQIACFRQTIQNIREPVSLSSSSAILHDYNSRDDWVRPGIMLAGISPLQDNHEAASLLKPVMELTANIIATREVPANSTIGYGNTFVTKRKTRIGIVPIGYGDGYPREVSPQTPAMVCGRKTVLAGRVSMDALSIDITDIPESRIGSVVQLWGPELSASEVATCAGTIPYTLTSGIQRIAMEYVDNSSTMTGSSQETDNCESSFSA